MLDDQNEEWFYRVMIVIEGLLGKNLNLILNSKNNSTHQNNIMFSRIFRSLDMSTKTIKRLYEKCDPEFFFKKLRFYLKGYEDKELFPNGL